jgi:autotransporter-associated beta strand protein
VYIYGYGFNGLITSAGKATIILNGGTAPGTSGANIFFYNYATGGEARLIANGGTNGGQAGSIQFGGTSDGGAVQVEVYDRAYLNVSGRVDEPSITVGSLAGTGFVYTGSSNLTIGSSNLSTTFSGVIREEGGFTGNNGTITKIGTGTLTLEGASTYDGGTTVSDGVLKVNNATGSATGTGPVQVDAGTLGGKGIIAGAVTVGTGSGTGAFLQPGRGASTAITLTLQNTLTFKSDGTYIWKLNTKKAKADQVTAIGVTIQAGAQFDLNTVGNKKLTAGKAFTTISNTAATPISGTFANLADGSTVTAGVNKLQVSYSGGDGNDLTLTVVP